MKVEGAVGAANTKQKWRDAWRTPVWLVLAIQAIIGRVFALDVAASFYNAVCSRYLDVEMDAIAMGGETWAMMIHTDQEVGDGPRQALFCNPPYSELKLRKRWVAQCIAAARAGARIVMLVSADPSVGWYHEILRSGTVELKIEIEGRIHFELAYRRLAELHPRYNTFDFDALIAHCRSQGPAAVAALLAELDEVEYDSRPNGGVWALVLGPDGSRNPPQTDIPKSAQPARKRKAA